MIDSLARESAEGGAGDGAVVAGGGRGRLIERDLGDLAPARKRRERLHLLRGEDRVDERAVERHLVERELALGGLDEPVAEPEVAPEAAIEQRLEPPEREPIGLALDLRQQRAHEQ